MGDPVASGILVRAGSPSSSTPSLADSYSRLPAETTSWTRGFLGRPPLALNFDQPLEAFIASFETRLLEWMTSLPSPSPLPRQGQGGIKPPSLSSAGIHARLVKIARLEANFVSLTLRALARWHSETEPLVLWDIDETLIGFGSRVRFLRPSSEAVLQFAARAFPQLRHGVLSSLSPEWIPLAVDLIQKVLGPGSLQFDSGWCWSFRPGLDRFEGLDWAQVRPGLRARDWPDCPPGPFPHRWPVYITEFNRLLSVSFFRASGLNAKVIDNDLNACFDEQNPAENRLSTEARHWLHDILGDHCATGPHWWPQEAEEWILELLRDIPKRDGAVAA